MIRFESVVEPDKSYLWLIEDSPSKSHLLLEKYTFSKVNQVVSKKCLILKIFAIIDKSYK